MLCKGMSANQPMDTSEPLPKTSQSDIAQKTWEIKNNIQGNNLLNFNILINKNRL